MATGRSPQHVWSGQGQGDPQSPAFPWAPPRQTEETEVPRGWRDLPRSHLPVGRSPDLAVVTTVLDFGSFPGLALADQAAVNILLQILFNFFLFLLDGFLGDQFPEVEGLGCWAGEVL